MVGIVEVNDMKPWSGASSGRENCHEQNITKDVEASVVRERQNSE
jgi:hypothetical protein